MEALRVVRTLDLPDCYLAAGFVRNLVWDHLHHSRTELNDVDVIYYDKKDTKNTSEKIAQYLLDSQHPEQNWQVKNQAFTHLLNNDRPYRNTLDAMSFWPEKETAVGARLNTSNQIEIISAFGTGSLEAGFISYNPNRNKAIFEQRVDKKKWLELWPDLTVVIGNEVLDLRR